MGPNTEKDVPKVPNIFPEKFLENKNQFNFIIAHISNEEVLEIIKSLKNKSTGPSSIPLQKNKIVKVILIHKGGSTQDLNNFRPISLLSIFDKIIEKIIHKKLYHFLDLRNILIENQFGFR